MMKVTETIERQCCDEMKDMKPYLGPKPRHIKKRVIKFCVHCGSVWQLLRREDAHGGSHWRKMRVEEIGGVGVEEGREQCQSSTK